MNEYKHYGYNHQKKKKTCKNFKVIIKMRRIESERYFFYLKLSLSLNLNILIIY